MKPPRMRVLVIVLLGSILAFSQQSAESSSSAHYQGFLTASLPAAHVSLPRNAPVSTSLPFTVENPRNLKFPEEAARRIFEEAVHEVQWQLGASSSHALSVDVTLRLGDPRDYVETNGATNRTTLSMRKWDKLLFARMVTRAIRDSLFSNDELDAMAVSALQRADSRVSVRELRGR